MADTDTPLEFNIYDLTEAEKAAMEKGCKTPPSDLRMGTIHVYYGGDFFAPQGMKGDWYSWCNNTGSDCGPQYWKFPVAKYRDMTVLVGQHCNVAGKVRVKIQIKWGNV